MDALANYSRESDDDEVIDSPRGKKPKNDRNDRSGRTGDDSFQ